MRILLIFILLSSLFNFSNAQENKYINWSFKTGDKILSHPLIDNDVVYFGSNDKLFYALDSKTGEKIWSFETNFSIRSKAVIRHDFIYFKSGNEAYLLNKNRGIKIWEYIDENTIGAEAVDYWDYHAGDAIMNYFAVFFGFGNGKLCALDWLNGKPLRQFTSIDSAAIKSTPYINGSVVYFGDWNGRVYAYDYEKNDTLWTYKTYDKQEYPTFGQLNTSFFVYDSLLVCGGRNPNMQVLNINTGKPVWNYMEKDGGWISGDPAVVNDTLYIGGSDNHKMIAFNIYSGEKYWEYEFLFNSFSKPLIYKNYILFTTGDAYTVFGKGHGHGYLYALNKKDGSIKNVALIGGNIFSHPVIYGNNIFLSSEDGFLYSVNLEKFISNEADLNKIGYRAVDILKISPNPFKENTSIAYRVNFDTEILLRIIDINGAEIKELYSGNKTNGEYSINWNGNDNEDQELPKGYYFFEISAGEYFKNTFLQKVE